ncbi:hypothetical protein [Mycoavidus sp. B2-EB]|uniref:hypothetical protein n=1 Tax=Mycoavidus sp. B2-EB TaxID=2651972 RepID=UPI00162A99D5|nr:hypothetical protein [Mycoavidus sp. B2-EB]
MTTVTAFLFLANLPSNFLGAVHSKVGLNLQAISDFTRADAVFVTLASYELDRDLTPGK